MDKIEQAFTRNQVERRIIEDQKMQEVRTKLRNKYLWKRTAVAAVNMLCGLTAAMSAYTIALGNIPFAIAGVFACALLAFVGFQIDKNITNGLI